MGELFSNYFNFEDYKDIIYNEKIINPENNICIIMCLYKRIYRLKTILELLDNQTVKNLHLYIWNNNYENNKELEDIINSTIINYNISWYNSFENIGGIGRFVFIRKLLIDNKNYDKVIFIDDDQEFDNDAIETLINKYKPNSSYHFYGKNFFKKSYQKSITTYSVNFDYTTLDYGGTGFMIIDINIFKSYNVFNFNIKYQFIEDLWLSYYEKKFMNYDIYHCIELRKKVRMINDGFDQYKNLISLKNEFLELLRTEGEWDV